MNRVSSPNGGIDCSSVQNPALVDPGRFSHKAVKPEEASNDI